MDEYGEGEDGDDLRPGSPPPPPIYPLLNRFDVQMLSAERRNIKPPVECDSWCHTVVSEDKVFNYVWTIENFEKIVTLGENSKTMYSEQFVIPLRRRFTVWRLKIYPNGRTKEDEGYVTIFLKDSCRKEPANVRAIAEFSIVDGDGNRSCIKTVDKEFKVLHHSFGFNRFVKHTDLFSPASQLLTNGSLILSCKITIKQADTMNETNQFAEYLEDRETLTAAVSGAGETSKFRHDMMEMLTNAKEHAADVVIACSDGEIPCHTSILTARSPYFKAMFSMPMKESLNRRIDLTKEMDTKTMMTLLRFVYGGSIKPQKMTLSILEAADKYNLLDLKSACSLHLKKSINLENCIQMLITADRHSVKDLKGAAKEFILENSSVLHQSDAWRDSLGQNTSLLSELLQGLAASTPQAGRSEIVVGEENGTPVAKRKRKH
uniref:Speckle-type POZ protein n=1 Tax=Acartia pacifica TaxID=335913 RepID=A0A0U2M9H5_ACAPC|nr:speckle-type POZ protein [Acartia pacifica]